MKKHIILFVLLLAGSSFAFWMTPNFTPYGNERFFSSGKAYIVEVRINVSEWAMVSGMEVNEIEIIEASPYIYVNGPHVFENNIFVCHPQSSSCRSILPDWPYALGRFNISISSSAPSTVVWLTFKVTGRDITCDVKAGTCSYSGDLQTRTFSDRVEINITDEETAQAAIDDAWNHLKAARDAKEEALGYVIEANATSGACTTHNTDYDSGNSYLGTAETYYNVANEEMDDGFYATARSYANYVVNRSEISVGRFGDAVDSAGECMKPFADNARSEAYSAISTAMDSKSSVSALLNSTDGSCTDAQDNFDSASDKLSTAISAYGDSGSYYYTHRNYSGARQYAENAEYGADVAATGFAMASAYAQACIDSAAASANATAPAVNDTEPPAANDTAPAPPAANDTPPATPPPTVPPGTVQPDGNATPPQANGTVPPAPPAAPNATPPGTTQPGTGNATQPPGSVPATGTGNATQGTGSATRPGKDDVLLLAVLGIGVIAAVGIAAMLGGAVLSKALSGISIKIGRKESGKEIPKRNGGVRKQGKRKRK